MYRIFSSYFFHCITFLQQFIINIMYLNSKETIIGTFLREMTEISHASSHTIRAYQLDLHQVFAQVASNSSSTSRSKLNSSADLNSDFELDETYLLKKVKRAQMEWSHLSLATRQRKAATMKSFLRWLYEKNLITTPLQEKIEAPTVPKKIPHFLSIDEVLHLFDFLKKNSHDRNSDKDNFYLALLYLLYGGGLRVSEACHLCWKNIRIPSAEVLILGKGQKERWVVLPQKAMEAITALPRLSTSIWGPHGLTERKAYDWIRKLGKEAGLRTPLHPHALRHSYATHLITAGMNLRTLQELMGHSSLTSTEKYLHLSMDQLARTLDSHHPLGDEKTRRILKSG